VWSIGLSSLKRFSDSFCRIWHSGSAIFYPLGQLYQLQHWDTGSDNHCSRQTHLP
jgi:hypothetical protein